MEQNLMVVWSKLSLSRSEMWSSDGATTLNTGLFLHHKISLGLIHASKHRFCAPKLHCILGSLCSLIHCPLGLPRGSTSDAHTPGCHLTPFNTAENQIPNLKLCSDWCSTMRQQSPSGPLDWQVQSPGLAHFEISIWVQAPDGVGPRPPELSASSYLPD